MRVRRRRKNSTLVVGENFQPGAEIVRVIRPWLQFRRDTEIGAEIAASELCNQLLSRAKSSVLVVATEIAVHAVRRRRPMRRLVTEDGDIGRRIAKTRERRHLDMIAGGRVKRLVAAMPDHGARGGEEAVRVFDSLDRIAYRSCRGILVLGQAFDLRDIENRIGFEEGDFAIEFLARRIDIGLLETAGEDDH